MRILIAVDDKPYSAVAVEQTACLARNTWADVTILGVPAKTGFARAKSGSGLPEPARHFAAAMDGYRENFLQCFEGKDCPYTQYEYGYELIEVLPGVWEQLLVARSRHKELRIKIRPGNPVREILSEAGEQGCNLIVIGGDRTRDCHWEHGGGVPKKVASDAQASVLVIKASERIDKVLCCLDHGLVSHESLEMVNQMVTLHQAELTIVALSHGEDLQEEVERKLDWMLKYYASRQITPLIEVVPIPSLETFLSQEGRWGLVALWMGKKSILHKAFSHKTLDKLIRSSQSSVLLLR